MSDSIPFIVLSMVAVAFLLLLCGCKRQEEYINCNCTLITASQAHEILYRNKTAKGVRVFHSLNDDSYYSRDEINNLLKTSPNKILD
jgi:hypothetical protein